jgi:hypothetical protein
MGYRLRISIARSFTGKLFLGRSTERLSSESVTNARLSLNYSWFCRLWLDFLAQMGDVNAEVLPMLLGFWAPDFAQDVSMRKNTSGMFHE